MLTVHGKWWQHAQDLERRWIFNGLDSQVDHTHAVIIPIYLTRAHITELLKDGVADPQDVVNLSGVMSTSPNGIHNLHFLFGPQATKNLSVATAWVLSNPWRALLDNAAKKGMRIIETTREEHDKKMAIIQWLSHFLLVLLGWLNNDDIQKSLIDPWVAPIGTVQDMIFQNSPAEGIITEFFDTIWWNGNDPLKTFQAIIDKHLTPNDIERFSTPNFRRILTIISEWNIQISLHPRYIQSFRQSMNSHGMRFISGQILAIRQ